VTIKGAGDIVDRLPVAARLVGFRLEGLVPSRFALLLGLGKYYSCSSSPLQRSPSGEPV
jgi:hypothetical protein